MRALLGRNDRGVADQRVVDTRIRNQIGLELIKIHVERTVESQTRCDGADNLGNQTVEMLVVRAGNVQIATADIVHGLVVDKESAVGVLDCAVGGKDSIVGLNDGRRDTRSRVYGELELALLAVVGGETLKKESTESRTSSATERVEDEEALKGRAVV